MTTEPNAEPIAEAAAPVSEAAAKAVGEGIFGHVQVEGVAKTAQHHLKEMKFWSKDLPKGKGVAFGRVAAVGAGLGLSVDALRSKAADGEDRSLVTRGMELLAGVGVAGTGLLAGRAV